MSFTRVQSSGSMHVTNGTLALTLPNQASAVGSLLVVIIATTSSAQSTPPAQPTPTTGWELVKAVAITGGRIEHWCLRNNSGSLYFASAATFTNGTADMRGDITEYSSGQGTLQSTETVGTASSSSANGTMMPVTTAGGTFAGELGIFAALQLYSTPVPSGVSTTWSVPAGYTRGSQTSTFNTTFLWNSDFNLGLAATAGVGTGQQSATGGQAYQTSATGWAAMLVCYRATQIFPINAVGAEIPNTIDLDPTGQQIAFGGDIWGLFKTASYGDDWQPCNYGIELGPQQSIGFVAWSLLETGTIYMGGGHSAGDGKFFASTDGGCTWAQRSTSTIWWYGNATPSPPRPSGNPSDGDRSVHQLLAQDPAGSLLYSVTGNGGVMRSADKGIIWASLPVLNGAAFFPRCIVINPLNPAQLWVGMWDTGNGNGGVYYSANANATNPASVSWTQLGGSQSTFTQLAVVGGYLYGITANKGIFRSQIPTPPAAMGNMVTVGTGLIDTTGQSIWTTMAGYVDGSGNHQLVAACTNGVITSPNTQYTNIVQVTLAGGNTPGTVSDLTGATSINRTTFPPFGQTWFHAGASGGQWPGGSSPRNPHVIVDPSTFTLPQGQQRIYMSTGGGFYRSYDSGQHWALAINGMPGIPLRISAADPNDPTHFITAAGDYPSMDLLDPTGMTGTAINSAQPPSPASAESRGCAFDPVDSRVYCATNTKFGQNLGGNISWRVQYLPTVGNVVWNDTGYTAQVTSGTPPNQFTPAPTGLFAGRDNANARFLVTVAQGLGIYRWAGPTGKWAKATVSDTSTPGQGFSVGQRQPVIVADASPGVLYLLDNPTGLYCSLDFGQSWIQVWNQTTAGHNSGFLAAHPVNSGELIVALDANLYKLTNASGGTVSGGQVHTAVLGGGLFSAGASGVAYAPNGALFATALGGTAPAPAVSTLYVSFNDGATWADYCNGDGSMASYGTPAGQIVINSAGYMWGSDSMTHFGWWDLIPLSQTAALSGFGSLTAVVSNLSGTAALSGTGTLTANPTVAQTAILSGHGTLTAVGSGAGPFAGTAALNGIGTLTALPALIAATTIIPPYAPQQPLLIADANDWFTWFIAYKLNATSRNNTTLAPDPDLAIMLIPGAAYEVRLAIFYDGPNGPNLQFNFAYPTDAVMNVTWWYPDASGSVSNHVTAGNAAHQANTSPGSTTETIMALANIQSGLIAGSLSFQWAQNSSSTSNVTVQPYSVLMMRRIQ